MPHSAEGHSNFVVLVDDYTGFLVTSTLKAKSDAPSMLKSTLPKMQNLFNVKCSKLRSDQDSVFTSHDFQTWLDDNFIEFQPTSGYSPQENGHAERSIRTVSEILQAMLSDSGLNKKYWGHPPGYSDGSCRVCRLIKSLYGLKQAPRVWHETLRDHLLFLGCIQCLSDGALFLYSSKNYGLIIILMYVDDLQIATVKLSAVNFMKKCILDKFPGSHKGETDYFLQMPVTRDRPNRNIVLRQNRHIDDLVAELKLSNAHPRAFQ